MAATKAAGFFLSRGVLIRGMTDFLVADPKWCLFARGVLTELVELPHRRRPADEHLQSSLTPAHTRPQSKHGRRDVLVWRAAQALDALCASFKVDGVGEKMSPRTQSLLAAVCTTVRSFPVCEAIRAAARGLDGWLDGVVRDMVVGGKAVRGPPAALADSRWSGIRVVDEPLPLDNKDENRDRDGEDDESVRTDRTSTYWLVGIGALATLYAAALLKDNVQIDVVEE